MIIVRMPQKFLFSGPRTTGGSRKSRIFYRGVYVIFWDLVEPWMVQSHSKFRGHGCHSLPRVMGSSSYDAWPFNHTCVNRVIKYTPLVAQSKQLNWHTPGQSWSSWCLCISAPDFPRVCTRQTDCIANTFEQSLLNWHIFFPSSQIVFTSSGLVLHLFVLLLHTVSETKTLRWNCSKTVELF